MPIPVGIYKNEGRKGKAKAGACAFLLSTGVIRPIVGVASGKVGAKT